MNWRRIRRIVNKEFIQLSRDPRLLRLVLFVPVAQLLIFGYAVTTDVRHVRTGIYDEDRTARSRALAEAFARSGYFSLDRHLTGSREIDPLLEAGAVQMILHIPRGFGTDLARERTAVAQILLDGSDSMTAGIISGYAEGVLRAHSQRVTLERQDRLRAPAPRAPGIESRLRVWYNPELKSLHFMVPGVLCGILLITTTALTSLAIVKEREIGTLEQLVVTPIQPGELMLGKVLPFILIGYIDLVLVLAVSSLWFRVPVAGGALWAVPLLLALSGVFLLSSLGMGLLISTVSRTQQEAMMTSFFLIMPSLLLSGFLFPIENMPAPVQWITHLIPLRYFLSIVRGIFLKGNGLAILWPQVAALTVIGLGLVALSAARFSKRMG